MTIDEIIEHCNRTCENTEMIAIARGQNQEDITSKGYWEHYQVANYLEELKQYRAIGTVEDIKALSSMEIHNFNALQKYRAIGTIEEFKALKEKNTPYKPQEYEDRYYACKCDNILLPKWRKYPTELMPKSEGLPHCMACGQKLDWSE